MARRLSRTAPRREYADAKWVLSEVMKVWNWAGVICRESAA
jgi:hypothetical protein